MVKHNNVVPNRHFHKDWQVRVRTWFNQPGKKRSRRLKRDAKAEKNFPRPVAGPLRPAVRPPTQRYNMKLRAGRGFTLEELKLAKISKKEAKGLGIAVDHRRRNKCNESLQLNANRLKKYQARLVVFPRKKGVEWTEAMTSAVANKNPNVLDISNVVKEEKPRAIDAEEKEFSAYGKIRIERMNQRQVGPRFVAKREAAEKAEKKKK